MQDDKRSCHGKFVLVCAYCNKILKDNDVWETGDVGVLQGNQSNLSHGICPDCLKEHFPHEYLAIQEERKEKTRNAFQKEFKEFYGHIAR